MDGLRYLNRSKGFTRREAKKWTSWKNPGWWHLKDYKWQEKCCWYLEEPWEVEMDYGIRHQDVPQTRGHRSSIIMSWIDICRLGLDDWLIPGCNWAIGRLCTKAYQSSWSTVPCDQKAFGTVVWNPNLSQVRPLKETKFPSSWLGQTPGIHFSLEVAPEVPLIKNAVLVILASSAWTCPKPWIGSRG